MKTSDVSEMIVKRLRAIGHADDADWKIVIQEVLDGLPGLPPPLSNIASDPDFLECMKQCDKILAVKGHDYTQGQPNRLANFDQGAQRLGMTPFRVLGVYWHKHVEAIYTFLQKGSVESEPIEGRIFDVINYMLLLYKMVKR